LDAQYPDRSTRVELAVVAHEPRMVTTMTRSDPCAALPHDHTGFAEYGCSACDCYESEWLNRPWWRRMLWRRRPW
jgi:hypothetical protein